MQKKWVKTSNGRTMMVKEYSDGDCFVYDTSGFFNKQIASTKSFADALAAVENYTVGKVTKIE